MRAVRANRVKSVTREESLVVHCGDCAEHERLRREIAILGALRSFDRRGREAWPFADAGVSLP